MGMPSSSATARTSSGAIRLALSGPFENTMITLRPGTLEASRRVIARHCRAKAENGIVAIVCERRGPRKIAAESVDRHRIGFVQAAHEIGDSVGSGNKSAVHIVAGLEKHEHVGADERVGAHF